MRIGLSSRVTQTLLKSKLDSSRWKEYPLFRSFNPVNRQRARRRLGVSTVMPRGKRDRTNLRLLHGTLGEIVCKRNARAVLSRELYRRDRLYFPPLLVRPESHFFKRSIRPTLKLSNFPSLALSFLFACLIRKICMRKCSTCWKKYRQSNPIDCAGTCVEVPLSLR